jgi:hypothetical protein
MSKNERRKGHRKNKQFAFQFKTIGTDGNNLGPVDGVLIDYSVAGIRFVTSEQLGKNTALLIDLEFDNFGSACKEWRTLWQENEAKSLQVIGSVMWCQENKQKSGEFEVGTRFIEKALQP